MTSANPPESIDLWWAVPGVLAGMSYPDVHSHREHTQAAALADYPDDLPALWRAGVRAIVCLLNRPGLACVYEAAGFACLLLPITEEAAPTARQFEQFLAFVHRQRALGHPVAVHCQAGTGRTGAVVAGFLLTTGFTPEAAIAHVRSVRPGAVSGRRQRAFLEGTYAAIRSQTGQGHT